MNPSLAKPGFISLVAALASFSHSASAACLVYVPEKTYLHSSGYTIRLDLESLLSSKGYEETDRPELAQYLFLMKGEEIEGRIHRAKTTLSLNEFSVTKDRVCLTQWCGVSDYGVAFGRAYRAMMKSLPACNE